MEAQNAHNFEKRHCIKVMAHYFDDASVIIGDAHDVT